MSVIDVENVTWTYPGAEGPALEELDLSIEPGEFVVLCGASGSGKSTALRLLNGLIPQFHEDGRLAGTVRVDGVVTTEVELDEIGRLTGTVLQHPRRQFFTDSAPEEIAFAMENFGRSAPEIRVRVASLLDALHTGLDVATPLRRLSGGQQQQVAIAAATAHEPLVLLLDEPSSNLSADAVRRLGELLAALKAAGTTVVVAEHRLRYLTGLADRVVVMRDGRIDRQWSAEQFARVTDEQLAQEGLRGDVRRVDLPLLPARGRSVARPGHVGEVPHGALELEDVRCRLGGRTVLEIDRVAFPAGQVTAVRGTNGTGKTTLARIVTGLQRSPGTVRLAGRRLTTRARLRASAMVMQDVQRQLFTDSVAAEVALATSGTPGGGETSEVLRRLDLEQLSERHPLSLSGGQQQRLVLATVRLAGRPVVVFDEPSSGVDRRHLRSIAEQIRGVAADGAVVLLISHGEDLLALAADQALDLVPLPRHD